MHGFPHKNWYGGNKNWKDLGEVKPEFHSFNKIGEKIVIYDTHKFCNTRVHIGRDHDGTLFKFCPRCLVKI